MVFILTEDLSDEIIQRDGFVMSRLEFSAWRQKYPWGPQRYGKPREPWSTVL